jgi:hypothetical protein
VSTNPRAGPSHSVSLETDVGTVVPKAWFSGFQRGFTGSFSCLERCAVAKPQTDAGDEREDGNRTDHRLALATRVILVGSRVS